MAIIFILIFFIAVDLVLLRGFDKKSMGLKFHPNNLRKGAK